MTITVPDEILTDSTLTYDSLLVEFAVFLYEHNLATIGQAHRIANIDLISFQKELAKHNIYIRMGIEDFHKDLQNLNLI